MEISGTREGYSLWKGTSTRELMRAEAHAWKFCGKDLDHLESYFVPIDFDQRYPDRKSKENKFVIIILNIVIDLPEPSKLTKKKFNEDGQPEESECSMQLQTISNLYVILAWDVNILVEAL